MRLEENAAVDYMAQNLMYDFNSAPYVLTNVGKDFYSSSLASEGNREVVALNTCCFQIESQPVMYTSE